MHVLMAIDVRWRLSIQSFKLLNLRLIHPAELISQERIVHEECKFAILQKSADATMVRSNGHWYRDPRKLLHQVQMQSERYPAASRQNRGSL
jgi:hypothetical protein